MTIHHLWYQFAGFWKCVFNLFELRDIPLNIYISINSVIITTRFLFYLMFDIIACYPKQCAVHVTYFCLLSLESSDDYFSRSLKGINDINHRRMVIISESLPNITWPARVSGPVATVIVVTWPVPYNWNVITIEKLYMIHVIVKPVFNKFTIC